MSIYDSFIIIVSFLSLLLCLIYLHTIKNETRQTTKNHVISEKIQDNPFTVR